MSKQLLAILVIAMTVALGCIRPVPQTKPPDVPDTSLPSTVQQKPTSQVIVSAPATKIAQLIGENERERQQPTLNLTWSRYKLLGTDLGVPFRHKGKTYLLFGDTVGLRGGDAIAYTTDTTPEDGIELTFIHDDVAYKPVKIPGISQEGFEVPMEGISVGGRMYIYHTTDSIGVVEMFKEEAEPGMGRSIVAVSDDDGQTFTYLYDFSSKHFINVSVVEVDRADLSAAFAPGSGKVLVIFGSGPYRRSDVYLAVQSSDQIGSRSSVRYFAGLDNSGRPILSPNEDDAEALFSQPVVGELSVTYNRFINKWIMLYNSFMPTSRGINIRTADKPWGPWSEPQIIFHPWDDNGYCHFMHAGFPHEKCDEVSDPNQEKKWGGEYGPYQFEDLAVGSDTSTTIYFTMSTWNPYTVVLMKATLQKAK
ncbi:MAG: DUF4185 domain-containing protein [Dehalococcoidia bacterium]|nr:DUF4185 domain-containing protein [Dehalococcoidia bacterium]